MIPYFSRKLNVLEISKNMLFMLDLLAIVQFLFRRCSPYIECVTILLNIFSFFIVKITVSFLSFQYFTDIMTVYFGVCYKNFTNRRDSL